MLPLPLPLPSPPPPATTKMPAPPRSKLEVTLISAQDLPPIARNLTTYAVAWLKPDYKLTTLIDNHGHTNPKWDHKFSFHLSENYSKTDNTTTLTLEIYNVGWLRDILIGSCQVLVSNLVAQRSKSNRPFVIQLCRPTGILQGNVNLCVNLIDRSNDNVNVNDNINVKYNVNVSHDPIEKIGLIKHEKTNEKIRLERSRSERTAKIEDFLEWDEGGDDGGGRSVLSRSRSGCSMTQIGSVNSMMRPLPSEVAAALKDGLYSTAGVDIGGYVYSVRHDKYEPRNERRDLSAVVAKWQQKARGERRTPVVDDRRLRSSDHRQRSRNGRRGGGGGLFSCFGNVQGREFAFICGGNNEASKRKKKRKPKV